MTDTGRIHRDAERGRILGLIQHLRDVVENTDNSPRGYGYVCADYCAIKIEG